MKYVTLKHPSCYGLPMSSPKLFKPSSFLTIEFTSTCYGYKIINANDQIYQQFSWLKFFPKLFYSGTDGKQQG